MRLYGYSNQVSAYTYTLVRGALNASPPYRAFVVDGVIESRASTTAITPVATEGDAREV
mgnify:CR=1 FL=1